jgi:addiction module HigA family antidote
MAELKLSVNQLALGLHLPSARINAILDGKRGISVYTALRLGQYFGNSPRFWANLQMAFELAEAKRKHGAKIRAQIPAGYTLVISNHDRSPDGYRSEIRRLRRRLKQRPNDDGLRHALDAAECTLQEMENPNPEEMSKLLRRFGDAGRRRKSKG